MCCSKDWQPSNTEDEPKKQSALFGTTGSLLRGRSRLLRAEFRRLIGQEVPRMHQDLLSLPGQRQYKRGIFLKIHHRLQIRISKL
jgi:hypothetical protein